VLNQELAGPEEPGDEEGEVAEDKVNFDALEALELAKKYVCQLDIKYSINATRNRLENELYRLRATEKEKTRLIDWLNK
jgi:hypothetical protein